MLPWSAPIAPLAACPGCGHDVMIRFAVAYRKAGRREQRAGMVCDCVRCGARYTALDAGGVVAYGRASGGAARGDAGQPGAGHTPGGAGDGGGAGLFSDMETLD